jgi:Flp pilus assembly protein TadD/TolB-like protein
MLRIVRAGHLIRAAGAALAIALLPVLCCAQAAPEHRGAAAEAWQRGVFLVFPFENTGADARLDWLSEGLEELTIQRLSAAGQQVFTHEVRAAELERYGLPSSARLSRASMLRLAEDLDADYILFGNFASDGKNLTVEGRLLRVSPAALFPAVRESGTLEALMELHTRVVWRLLSSSDPGFPLQFEEFSRLQRPLRLDAFEHYIRGRLAAEDEGRVRELREAVRLEPDWPDPAFALGQASFARRDCATAISWFSRVPKTHDRYFEAVFSVGVCLLWLNQPERAEGQFLKLQDLLKNSTSGDLPEILNNLAVARLRSGKADAAQADLVRAAELDPDDDDYPFNLGLLALRADDFTGAAARFREAAGREPDDADARALLIYALERGGQKAEADAERAASLSEGEPLPAVRPETLPRLDRVKTELDTLTLRQEMETAEAAVPAAPARASVPATGPGKASGQAGHLRAGRQQLSAGRLPEAEREFRAALAADPHDAGAYRGLAEIARRQGRLEDAAEEYRASLKSRDSATVRTALARIYLEQKKTEMARQELEKALKLAPNYAEAKQLLQRLDAGKPGAGR